MKNKVLVKNSLVFDLSEYYNYFYFSNKVNIKDIENDFNYFLYYYKEEVYDKKEINYQIL